MIRVNLTPEQGAEAVALLKAVLTPGLTEKMGIVAAIEDALIVKDAHTLTVEETYRAKARSQYGTEDVEIDEDPTIATVSIGDDQDAGAWVQAWVWVRDDEADIKRRPAEDDGCPKNDPECLGNNGDCHDACESQS